MLGLVRFNAAAGFQWNAWCFNNIACIQHLPTCQDIHECHVYSISAYCIVLYVEHLRSLIWFYVYSGVTLFMLCSLCAQWWCFAWPGDNCFLCTSVNKHVAHHSTDIPFAVCPLYVHSATASPLMHVFVNFCQRLFVSLHFYNQRSQPASAKTKALAIWFTKAKNFMVFIYLSVSNEPL